LFPAKRDWVPENRAQQELILEAQKDAQQAKKYPSGIPSINPPHYSDLRMDPFLRQICLRRLDMELDRTEKIEQIMSAMSVEEQLYMLLKWGSRYDVAANSVFDLVECKLK
jgi:hypothetical protein